MALPPLAELHDVEARLGREIGGPELARVDALLADASAIVRTYTRREFSRTTTTERLRPRGHKVVLSQRPVVSVDSVAHVLTFGSTETVTPSAAWQHSGGSEILLGEPTFVINGPTFDLDDDVWVEITYTHGFTEIPDAIVAVVANLAVRALTAPQGGLIDSETIGPYTARYSTFTSAGPLSLSQADRAVLNRFRTGHRTVELR